MNPFLPSPRGRRLASAALASALVAALPGVARADDAPVGPPAPDAPVGPPAPPPKEISSVPRPFAYGVLVGTNAGGEGQRPLRYAEDDARRVGQVLRELGRFGSADLRVLTRPGPAAVLAAVDDVAAKIRAHAARGEQAVFVFFYSGHARATALSLGREELALATLRERVGQVPATLTLVVLDACQSGAYARAKGVEPARDFSSSSVARLTQRGVAVMASSSAEELSQESDELKGSYFTHHLVAGLRGAADADGDGRVSLDEAYRYAYRRTLASTAATQVGGQHVTLETDLSGQGDVPVTYPRDARAQLELAAKVEARVLVQHDPSKAVAVEVQKVAGAPLRLALAAGRYTAFVRTGPTSSAALRTVRCPVTLTDDRVTVLDPTGCEVVRAAASSKGPRDEADASEWTGRRRVDPLSVEVGVGFIRRIDSDYTSRLEEFGYKYRPGFIEIFKPPRFRVSLSAFHGVLPHVAVGAQLHTLAGDTYERRDLGKSEDKVSFDAYALSAYVRASTNPIGQLRPGGSYFNVYGQLGLGLGLGVVNLTTGAENAPKSTSTSTHWGYVLGGAAGLAFMAPRHFGVFLQGGYEYAPVIANLVGDTHDSGGLHGQLGARVRFE